MKNRSAAELASFSLHTRLADRPIAARLAKTVLTRELGALKAPELVEITGENGVVLTVELSKEGARITAASCPDKTCQRTGHLTRAGDVAVCLPGRIALRLEGPKTDQTPDAETY